MQLNEYVNKYSYRINFDVEDNVYIARCAEMESLTALGDTPEKALEEIHLAVKAVLKQIEER